MKLAGFIVVIVASGWLIPAGCIAFFKLTRLARGIKPGRRPGD